MLLAKFSVLCLLAFANCEHEKESVSRNDTHTIGSFNSTTEGNLNGSDRFHVEHGDLRDKNFSLDGNGEPIIDVDPLGILILAALLMEHNELLHYDFPGHFVITPPDPLQRSVQKGQIVASKIDESLSGQVDSRDETAVREMIVNKPPKLVRQRRAFFIGTSIPWPKGEYHYVFDKEIDKEIKKQILKAFRDIGERVPCVKFVAANKNSQSFVVHTSAGSGCFATAIGYTGGESVLNLQKGCDYGVTMHEIFHILGAIHTQNRPDRDKYVHIKWDNIEKRRWTQFEKMTGKVSQYDYEYDYNSTMHYPTKAFAVNSKNPVMSPLLAGIDLPVDGHTTFSESDYQSLRDWYGCGKRCPFGNCEDDMEDEDELQLQIGDALPPGLSSAMKEAEEEEDEEEELMDVLDEDDDLEDAITKLKLKKMADVDDVINKLSRKDLIALKIIKSLFNDKSKKRRRRTTPPGDVDCMLGPWSDWSLCQNSSHLRTRLVTQEGRGNGAACPPQANLTRTSSCNANSTKSQGTLQMSGMFFKRSIQEDSVTDYPVVYLKKMVKVVEGDPLVLVVSNPKNFGLKWYHVDEGDDVQISEQDDRYNMDRTSAGNNRLIIDEPTVKQDDGEIIVTLLEMDHTVLRVAWSIEVYSISELGNVDELS